MIRAARYVLHSPGIQTLGYKWTTSGSVTPLQFSEDVKPERWISVKVKGGCPV
jgi:hypothetical protein